MTDWDAWFMGFAAHAATKSKDPNTRVGCVLVGPDREIRSTGYNGLPRGVRDLEERMQRPTKYYLTAHAEENAVAQAARIGARLKGCSAYVTHEPCARCARSLIQAGISKVVIGPGKVSPHFDQTEFEMSRLMLSEAGVSVERRDE